MSQDAQPQDVPSKVECPAAKDPAVTKFIIAGMSMGAGIYCFIDAYIRHKYPWVPDGGLNDKLSYFFNHGGAIVFPLAALIPLIWGIVLLRRKLLADEEGIGYAGSQKVAWSDVTRLDSAKLADKGILKLFYRDAAGEEKRLVLDSWRLRNFRELVKLVESKVDAAPAEEEAEEAEEEEAEDR
ncbi:hypothetical protein LCGC14_1735350 [marine sediment metagenome]|uniref:DUF5673 domain-containing protein n=1 Tax=marine sediment metagenome TaxID=412755 RepID=A0A0F9H861_9ZZZZ